MLLNVQIFGCVFVVVVKWIIARRFLGKGKERKGKERRNKE